MEQQYHWASTNTTQCEDANHDEVVDCLLAGCGVNNRGQLGWTPSKSPSTTTQQQEVDYEYGCSLFTPLDWSTFHSRTARPARSAKKKVIGSTIAIPLNNEESSTMHQTSAKIPLHLAAISCGESHTLTCWRDGAVYAWGDNSYGQLGLEATSTGVIPPTRVSIFSHQQTNNNNSSVGIQQQGKNIEISTPLSKSLPVAAIVRTVACGSFHSLLVTSDGSLYTCGKNSYGCLGLGTLDDVRPHFTLVTNFLNDQQQKPIIIVGAAAGYAHSLALTQNGAVYSFGRGQEGQLGDGKMGSSSTDVASSLVHIDSVSIGSSVTLLESSLTSSEESNSTSLETPANSLANECPPTYKEPLGYSDIPTTRNQEDNRIGPTETFDKKHTQSGGNTHKSLFPTPVLGALTNNPVVMIACSNGGYGSYAVTAKDGSGWKWGLVDASKRKPKKKLVKYALSLPKPLPSPLGVESEDLLEEETAADLFSSSSFPVMETITTTRHKLEADKQKYSCASSRPKNSNNTIVSISAGIHHVVCVTRSGEAWAMGGPGPFLGLGHGCQMEWLHAPGRVLLPGDILINGVACGETHTLLTSICGKVFACGSSSKYLGVSSDDGKASTINENERISKNTAPITVPREISLLRISPRINGDTAAVSTKTRIAPDISKCKASNSTATAKVKSSFIGEYSYGRDSVCNYIQQVRENDVVVPQQRMCFERDPSTPESFEDDEDYWGEGDDFGYHNIDMSFGTDALGAPYGGGGLTSTARFAEMSPSLSSFKRFTCETKRHICNSTFAVGEVLLTGGQKLVSAMTSGLQVSSSVGSDPNTMAQQPHQRKIPRDSDLRRVLSPSKLIRSESQQDSFDGLTGDSKRLILLSAGKNFSVLYTADKLNS
jgi:alpha-tubulin suppressor-like RCC1 family protein